MNKKVYGVGTNDADYAVSVKEKINNLVVEVWHCPFHKRWSEMLKRCYSENYKKKYPTYNGCEVCEDWLTFSNFKKWMEKQEWEGNQLDKDILIEGNKLYSEHTCVFVDQGLNKFFNEMNGVNSRFLIGVTWHSRVKKFAAQCNNPFTGKRGHIGYFENELDAHVAWKNKKHEYAYMLASLQTDERIANSLRVRFAN